MEILKEVFTPHFVQFAWVPLALGLLTFLASRYGARLTGNTARQAQLDKRSDDLMRAQDKAVDDLRGQVREERGRREAAEADADVWRRSAQFWMDWGVDMKHAVAAVHSAVMSHNLLLRRRKPDLCAEHPDILLEVPERWHRPVFVPPLREPWAHPPPAPLPAPAGD